jgi:hypothetical protein
MVKAGVAVVVLALIVGWGWPRFGRHLRRRLQPGRCPTRDGYARRKTATATASNAKACRAHA